MHSTGEKTIREQIIDREWKMFQKTQNIGGRASCQDDFRTFFGMRKAQFDAWSDEAAESYLEDLKEAEDAGRNLIAEKYLRMMKYTHPAEYAAQQHLIPVVSKEKEAVADEICAEMVAQTQLFREKYPNVGKTGRPLYSRDDSGGYTSVQTYQRGELLTYSERTLGLLRRHLFSLKKAGKSLAEEIDSRSILSCGFSSLEEAESFLAAGVQDL